MSSKTAYSIVIPVYNEGERFIRFLPRIAEQLRALPDQGEIIIVDDGSQEACRTSYLALIQSLNQNSFIKFLEHERNQGKGAAIQTGFQAAQGAWVGFADADGATSAGEIIRLLNFALSTTQWSGVFGSRIRMLGYRVERHLNRHLSGRLFVTLASNLLNLPMYDPQCGCKFFKRSDILPLLKQCREHGYLFDLELVALGIQNGLQFLEMPIHWKDIPGSKVHIGKDGIKMFLDLIRLKKRLTKYSVR